ncbi:uncharacterized protein N7477_004836 [Penicillium maclennaniae]|uniref:uncharacterized protein n=1 Tax=Penicillium maclennaniae TaxID=1343394 RepID=UPI00253F7207|nr:uncharacterized protein N7477_004836 [Penicillium maclennaniae]KAJ5674902.1 hypothetical protein N7477_004836 [Penicillium maclennaniae]
MANSAQFMIVKLRLPHSSITTYYLEGSGKLQDDHQLLQLCKDEGAARPLPQALHNDGLYFTALQSLYLYAIFTARQEIETFRLRLNGLNAKTLAYALRISMVAIEYPAPLPNWNPGSSVPILDYTVASTEIVHRHPRRDPKPTPGEINDPRVATGWKETGTLEDHREYLRRQHEDPHTPTVLGHFNDIPLSYYKIFWAKEDNVGARYASNDFDRGRHTLVGNDAFRGPHRVTAW